MQFPLCPWVAEAPVPLSVVLVWAGRLERPRAAQRRAHPQPLILRVWGRPREPARPVGSQAVPMLLVRGPHLVRPLLCIRARGSHQPCMLQKVNCRQPAAGLAFELYLFNFKN